MLSIRRLRSACSALCRDRRGNFAVILALSALPVFGAAGLAVDYTNMSRTRSELQNALDAAVLAVAQRGDKISDAEARSIAASFLTGNLSSAYKNMAVERNGTSVKLSAEATMPLSFGGLIGRKEATVGASSTADMAFAYYEIALVLDTTGSMRGGKLQAMKEAVNGLIDDLSSRVTDKERLKFALVPFASFVNVGPQFGPEFDRNGRIVPGTGADWLDLQGISPISQLDLLPGLSRFEVAHHLGQDWKGCVETRMPTSSSAYDVDDAPVVATDRYSLFVPTFAIDEPDGGRLYANNYIASNTSAFGNSAVAIARRLLRYGLDDAAQAALTGATNLIGLDIRPERWRKVEHEYSDGRGPAYGCLSRPITPLSNDYAALKREVSRFTADGNTNIMEGVAWGMRVLSPREPFTEGKEPASDVEKIMIVLTDGANNMGLSNNRNHALGSSYSSFGYLVEDRLTRERSQRRVTEEMNRRTLAACENAKREYTPSKEDDVTIYTIRLEEPDVATGTLLQECATGPGYYFDSPSRTQLNAIFKEIRDGITKLRLSF
ncbi:MULTISPECIES: pilus assembly protein TadG-related protein [Chelativorans]|jgi:Flp pilus assembly protein TadG|uniref:VWFA domain-containing protein n=1 Tax=Chelativorans sp. (strain BNC1) TaxID=266779 RepID=Q11GJ8_CHESB|nr:MULTISPECIES: pilus assembly protein TadG-related protein [Chelativorans]